jgi:hypothetical protein
MKKKAIQPSADETTGAGLEASYSTDGIGWQRSQCISDWRCADLLFFDSSQLESEVDDLHRTVGRRLDAFDSIREDVAIDDTSSALEWSW